MSISRMYQVCKFISFMLLTFWAHREDSFPRFVS